MYHIICVFRLGGLAVVPTSDALAGDAGSAMIASYVKVAQGMEMIGHGVVRWSTAQQNFSLLANWSMSEHNAATGCCILHTHEFC